jgi:hypothetical protein
MTNLENSKTWTTIVMVSDVKRLGQSDGQNVRQMTKFDLGDSKRLLEILFAPKRISGHSNYCSPNDD